MKFKKLFNLDGDLIEGLKLITHDVFYDQRGYFYESWNKYQFEKFLEENISFCQLNQSHSKKGVLRGLHYQLKPGDQGKLVQCTKGSIFDVVVDIRKDSKTYSNWVGIELNEFIKQSLWVPPGFAHGFLTLSDSADLQYLVTKKWDKSLERCINWNDKNLGIDWPVLDFAPLVSEKDSKGLGLHEAESSNIIF